MKKTLLILISLLVCINSIWCYLFIHKDAIADTSHNKVRLYILNGTGVKWDVENYKILLSSEDILRGHAELVYKGEPSELADSTAFTCTFYERNDKNEKVAVYSNSFRSIGGPVSILNNVKDVGSISGAFIGDTQKTKDEFENTTIEISWNDGSGNSYMEMINLNISSEIELK